jgi:hypothetical protein
VIAPFKPLPTQANIRSGFGKTSRPYLGLFPVSGRSRSWLG